MKTCYMCDCEKSSYEHVPPKCFFPRKEIAGKDLRMNLITVPSCDLHNSKKSGDDEYLLDFILLNYSANDIAQKYFRLDRLNATHRHMSLRKKIQSYISNNPISLKIGGAETIGMNFNWMIASRALDHITRAIYFHHFGKKFLDKLVVYPLNSLVPDPRHQDFQTKLEQHLQIVTTTYEHFSSLPRYGNNQEIFYYQINDYSDYFSLRVCFYDGVDFLSVIQKNSS